MTSGNDAANQGAPGGSAGLQLHYALVPEPNPIRASLEGSNPNLIDLVVLVSNPARYVVDISQITIQIPVGSDSARSLSAAPSLPAPIYDASGPWKITSSGSVVTVAAAHGGSVGVSGEAIEFKLPGIAVNTTPSASVPVTITEFFPSAPKVTDSSTYALLKLDADFPVSDFYAKPRALEDLDEALTLYWQCTGQGAAYAYRVRSAAVNWEPKECLTDGDCFNCANGSAGVSTPPLAVPAGTTAITFYLDVIQTHSSGLRTVVHTIATTVPVEVPAISPNSYLTQHLGGRYVRLHWIAFNAARCELALSNGPVLVKNAPIDSYREGYGLYLGADLGTYTLGLTAFSASGSARQNFAFFPAVTISQRLATVAVSEPREVALARDGATLLVACGINEQQLVKIDLASNAVTGRVPIERNSVSSHVGLAPDGKLALVSWSNGNDVHELVLVDVASMRATKRIAIPEMATQITFHPSGRTAFLMNPLEGTVRIFDVAAQKPAASLAVRSTVACAADGILLFALDADDTAAAFDATTYQRVNSVRLPYGAYGLTVAPDGKSAVATHGDAVSVIDLVSWRVKATVALPSVVAAAITPDNTLALVSTAGRDRSQVHVIDLVKAVRVPGTIPVGDSPLGLAVTPDGTRIIVACTSANYISVI